MKYNRTQKGVCQPRKIRFRQLYRLFCCDVWPELSYQKPDRSSVGRALVGLEFETVADRDACREKAAALRGTTIQGLHELPDEVRHRVLDRMSPMDK